MVGWVQGAETVECSAGLIVPRANDAEWMSGWIQEHAKAVRTGLCRCLGCTSFHGFHFSNVEVIHEDVQVGLLWRVSVRPCWWSVFVDLLEADPRVSGMELDPSSCRMFDDIATEQ